MFSCAVAPACHPLQQLYLHSTSLWRISKLTAAFFFFFLFGGKLQTDCLAASGDSILHHRILKHVVLPTVWPFEVSSSAAVW